MTNEKVALRAFNTRFLDSYPMYSTSSGYKSEFTLYSTINFTYWEAGYTIINYNNQYLSESGYQSTWNWGTTPRVFMIEYNPDYNVYCIRSTVRYSVLPTGAYVYLSVSSNGVSLGQVNQYSCKDPSTFF